MFEQFLAGLAFHRFADKDMSHVIIVNHFHHKISGDKLCAASAPGSSGRINRYLDAHVYQEDQKDSN